MQLTTKTILKVLPFSPQDLESILEELEAMDADRKFYFERLIWDAYDAFYTIKLQENIQLGFLQAKNNKETLGEDFYQRMEELTEKQMEEQTLEASEKADLAQVRKAMEQIVKEIQAAKK